MIGKAPRKAKPRVYIDEPWECKALISVTKFNSKGSAVLSQYLNYTTPTKPTPPVSESPVTSGE